MNIRTLSWLKANHTDYDRIIYHIGNSHFHNYMLALQENIKGVVVLHDFYISGLMASAGKLDIKLLYKEHGFKAAQQYINLDTSKIIENYPLNKTLLNNALSVIVHSNYSKTLATNFYKQNSIEKFSVVPLLREPAQNNKELQLKNYTKENLLVCSFGILHPNKCNKQLIQAWLDSSLCKNSNNHLIFVGESYKESYTKELQALINTSSHPDNIHITAWTDKKTFKNYLSRANIAVQLRASSRGESSAAVLDCMNYATPTIVNANATMAELPQDCVYMLEDSFKTQALTTALETLYTDTNKKETLATNAKHYIQHSHNPKICAKLYHETIENTYKTTKQTHIQQTQILVDISAIKTHDLKTGIQRVVRSQLIELVKNAPDNYRVEAVYLLDDTFYYAREYLASLLHLENFHLKDEPVEINQGDILYSADLSANEVSKATKSGLYKSYKEKGVKIVFLVHDILPITQANYFPPSLKATHEEWLNNILNVSDVLFTVSTAVATDIATYIKENKLTSKESLPIFTLHSGSDITHQNHEPTTEYKNISFLVVGTIEPRKGHAQLLKAFEILWEEGFEINLIIVGKQGWMMEEFIQTLNSHSKLDKNLFYLNFVDDNTLNHLYTKVDALIAPSNAEGFGLPLIEAANYSLPIIARDIAVFREIADSYALYFKNTQDPKDISQTIKEWLKLYKSNKHPTTKDMPIKTYKQNAKELLSKICNINNLTK